MQAVQIDPHPVTRSASPGGRPSRSRRAATSANGRSKHVQAVMGGGAGRSGRHLTCEPVS